MVPPRCIAHSICASRVPQTQTCGVLPTLLSLPTAVFSPVSFDLHLWVSKLEQDLSLLGGRLFKGVSNKKQTANEAEVVSPPAGVSLH